MRINFPNLHTINIKEFRYVAGEALGGIADNGPNVGEAGGADESDSRRLWQSFINLSSIVAFVRHLFALNDVAAAIRISTIHIDQMPTNQKAGSSNLSGRTKNRGFTG